MLRHGTLVHRPKDLSVSATRNVPQRSHPPPLLHGKEEGNHVTDCDVGLEASAGR